MIDILSQTKLSFMLLHLALILNFIFYQRRQFSQIFKIVYNLFKLLGNLVQLSLLIILSSIFNFGDWLLVFLIIYFWLSPLILAFWYIFFLIDLGDSFLVLSLVFMIIFLIGIRGFEQELYDFELYLNNKDKYFLLFLEDSTHLRNLKKFSIDP